MNKAEAIKVAKYSRAKAISEARVIYDAVIDETQQMRDAAHRTLMDAITKANDAEDAEIKAIEEGENE